METIDLDNVDDVNIFFDEIVQTYLKRFNTFGTAICKNSLAYCIKYNIEWLQLVLENDSPVLNMPSDVHMFFTYIWEKSFGEKFPESLFRTDFFIDELDHSDLEKMYL